MEEKELYRTIDIDGKIWELEQQPNILNNNIVVILKMIKNYIIINNKVSNDITISIICETFEPILLKIINIFDKKDLDTKSALKLLGFDYE